MTSDAASHSGSPLRDPRGSTQRSDRARPVSADLEEIFGRGPPAARQTRPRGLARTRAPAARASGEPRHGLSAASLGGLAAAALAGVAAGVILVKSPEKPAPPKPRPALPVEIAAPAPPPAIQAPIQPAAAPATPPVTRPVAKVKAATPRRVAPRQASPTRAQIQAADGRLRAAYTAAIRAGAPRATLIESRDRWVTVRRRAARDPARLVNGYNDIARDLERAAARGRARAIRASDSKPRSRFRPRFRAWW